LKDLLGYAHEKGGRLVGEGEEHLPKAQEWVWYTYALIEAAFDKGEAQRFLSNEGYTLPWLRPMDNLMLASNTFWISARLWRLEHLITRMDSLTIRPGFDPQDRGA
jgi:hypothetical protein